MKRPCAPARAAATAWLAPLPPQWTAKVPPTTVSPGPGRAAECTTRSTLTLPKTVSSRIALGLLDARRSAGEVAAAVGADPSAAVAAASAPGALVAADPGLAVGRSRGAAALAVRSHLEAHGRFTPRVERGTPARRQSVGAFRPGEGHAERRGEQYERDRNSEASLEPGAAQQGTEHHPREQGAHESLAM